MDARKAFERFEKTGAGLLPFFLVAGLTISATILFVNLWCKVPSVDPAAVQTLIHASRPLAKVVGYGIVERSITAESSNFEWVENQRKEIESAFPEDRFQYVGPFEVTGIPDSELLIYCDNSRQIFIEIACRRQGDQPQAIGLSSQTLDGEGYFTSNIVLPHFKIPWRHWEVVAASGSLGDIVEKLLESHRGRVASLQLQAIDPANYLQVSSENSAEVGNWLIEQAPLPASLLAEYVGDDWPSQGNKNVSALLLIGFCDGTSDDYDRVAIETFRQQEIEAGRPAPESSRLVAVHAMSNEYHLAKLFPHVISERELTLSLDREWMVRTAAQQKTDSNSVESLIRELERRARLREVGSIEKPFNAKLYQKAD